MSNLIHISKEYRQWIQSLSQRFRRSQIKASVKVNQEMLRYYWDLGRDIVARDAENVYGHGFYANLSQDLRNAIPNTEGFSETSIRYAKRFYELYFQLIRNLPQVGEILDEENLPQVGEEFTGQVTARLQQDIFSIPWGHHKLLIDKCSSDPNCRQKSNTLAQYALESSSQPLGISEYELQKLYPAKIEGTMPTIEEIENELNETNI